MRRRGLMLAALGTSALAGAARAQQPALDPENTLYLDLKDNCRVVIRMRPSSPTRRGSCAGPWAPRGRRVRTAPTASSSSCSSRTRVWMGNIPSGARWSRGWSASTRSSAAADRAGPSLARTGSSACRSRPTSTELRYDTGFIDVPDFRPTRSREHAAVEGTREEGNSSASYVDAETRSEAQDRASDARSDTPAEPDVAEAWVPAHGNMKEVTDLVESMHGNGDHSWFGKRVPITVRGKKLEPEPVPS